MVGSNNTINAHYTQLGVVLEATLYLEMMLPCIQMSPWKIHVTIVVSNSAILQLLAKLHLQGRQALIAQVTEAINWVSEMGSKINL